MLNLRDPKIQTAISGPMTRGTTTTGRKQVLFYLRPEILICFQQISTKSHREIRVVQLVRPISVLCGPLSEVYFSLYWDGATGAKCEPGRLGKLRVCFTLQGILFGHTQILCYKFLQLKNYVHFNSG